MAKSTPAQQEKFGKVMREGYKGKLHSGSKHGPVVTNPAQMKAIAASEAGMPPAAKNAPKGAVKMVHHSPTMPQVDHRKTYSATKVSLFDDKDPGLNYQYDYDGKRLTSNK